jgi:hypothetical protein
MGMAVKISRARFTLLKVKKSSMKMSSERHGHGHHQALARSLQVLEGAAEGVVVAAGNALQHRCGLQVLHEALYIAAADVHTYSDAALGISRG